MCFSANASFGASIILGAVSVVAIRKAATMPQCLFAVVPFLFSIQQAAEGVVWLSLMNAGYTAWLAIAVHIFLLFAYVVWPVWVPLTIMLLITGAFTSLYIAACMLLYPVHAAVNDHHIKYTFGYPQAIHDLRWLSDTFYFISTLAASFIATTKKVWLFGIVLIAAYIVSRVFFKDAVISVWYYFAALLSVVILYIIQQNKAPASSDTAI